MKILVTGGLGFIGINAVKRFLREGNEVIIFDNASRKGAEYNLEDLKESGKFKWINGDIENFDDINQVIIQNKKLDLVLHLAAQVAVTTSVENPRLDFRTNALGTFNLLEALRTSKFNGLLINASTNKVYGGFEHVQILEKDLYYEFVDQPLGISERMPLDFHSPYGCSKGTADQYVMDYSRVYGMNTVTFRQSCIYGPHQYGVEDQGWVAWFTIAALTKKPITIYGNGKQVRDVLYVDDLVGAFLKAYEHRKVVNGKAYNIGGGTSNQLSLLQLLAILEKRLSSSLNVEFSDWRPGDQRIYVSDVRRAQDDIAWTPRINIESGVGRLVAWVEENHHRFT